MALHTGTGRFRALATAGAAAIGAVSAQKMLFVDCNNGSDAGNGSAQSPFLTLTKARDTIRSYQPISDPWVVQVLESDCYPRDASGAVNFTFSALELDGGQDGGTAQYPITYTSAPGARVRLMGGPSIPASAWRPYKGSILQADLGPQGLNLAQYGFGSLAAGGLGTCDDTGMEFFWNNTPMTLARWPNIAANGTWQWANIATVDSALAFTTDSTRALSWNNQPNAWVHGYWSFDWADSYVAIANVTAVNGGTAAQITVSSSTPPLYGFEAKARFMGVNMLSELDAEGEYFIDVASATLYFWPPGGDVSTAEAYVSVADYGIASGVTMGKTGRDGRRYSHVPHKQAWEHVARPSRTPAATATTTTSDVTASGATLSYVTINGLHTYFFRQKGVAIAAGNHVTVSNLEASNHGHNAVTIAGTNCAILNVTATGTGCEALSMYGGDPSTITPGGNVVANCSARQYARVIRTYNPGVGWGGVGNLFTGNTVADAPHNGMLGGGVLNNFTNNVFNHLCYEATDSGAWYAGRSWTNRGNLLQGNTFTEIRNQETMTLGSPSVQAIYLDDQLSGTIIVNNSCVNAQKCFFIGGGRDTIVANNYCEDTDVCVHIDNRGMNWQLSSCTYNATYTGQLVAQLFAVNYTQAPYATAFPSIVNTLQYHPCVPVNISVTGNTFCNVHQGFIDATANQTASWYDLVNANANVTRPGGGCQ